MNQVEKGKYFASLHVKGDPVVLFNIWDAGGAQAIEKAGAKAVATGSWSVAAAHGYADGESIPLVFIETIVERICATSRLPVTIDFEGGYATEPAALALNIQRIIRAGAIGINFEDQIVNGTGLHDLATQSKRINAIRKMADQMGIPLFINARTDLFLQAADSSEHAALIDSVRERADRYEKAGANCLFVPGLVDANLIAQICEATALPVNVMFKKGVPSISELADLGVARISFGPAPYLQSMDALSKQAEDVFA